MIEDVQLYEVYNELDTVSYLDLFSNYCKII